MIIAIIWIVLAVLFFIFTFVLLVGAPYVPTLPAQRKVALELLDLKPGQILYELGSGDGSLLKDAAAAGLRVVGYELNPLLAVLSWLRTRRYGRKVKIVCGSFWKADLSKADGVYVFLIDHFMNRLDSKIKAENKDGLKLVSNAFEVPGRKADKKRNAMRLYEYPKVARKS